MFLERRRSVSWQSPASGGTPDLTGKGTWIINAMDEDTFCRQHVCRDREKKQRVGPDQISVSQVMTDVDEAVTL